MRKILSIMFCLFISINIFSQIEIDKAELDGTRFIVSKRKSVYSLRMKGADVGLAYIRTSLGDESYQIDLYLDEGKMGFDIGRRLLIKLKDDTVIELKNCVEIGPGDYKYEEIMFAPHYYTNPMYIVSLEDLQKIINGEVVKIRIENNIEFFDRNIQWNKFSKALKKAFDAINSRKTVKNDVYEGF